jgi:general nucleoside transport system permease protein
MTDQLASSVPVAETGRATVDLSNANGPGKPRGASEGSLGRDILTGSWIITVLAVFLGVVVGLVLIIATNNQVQTAAGYFLGRPGDTFIAIGNAIGGACDGLFRGGVYDYQQTTFTGAIGSLFNTINNATPLIAAGLGLAIGFRAGVFNIGGQGIILVAGALAGWVGFAWSLPPVIHMLVAVLAALLGAAIWSGIVGVLKAFTGAHEVIVTIMMNYVAFYLLDFLLHTPVLRAPGTQNPQSPPEKDSAILFPLLGPDFKQLNFGFVLVILATVAAWWLLSRSSLGFRLRAVGENPRAARTGGINVNRTFIAALVLSGVFVGLAGAYQVLGQNTSGFGNTFDSGVGVTCITVALLGRNRPGGVFAAGLAFGFLQAGGATLQASQGIDIDIAQVMQYAIVLFIAAPPLIRTMFRLPAPGARQVSAAGGTR